MHELNVKRVLSILIIYIHIQLEVYMYIYIKYMCVRTYMHREPESNYKELE